MLPSHRAARRVGAAALLLWTAACGGDGAPATLAPDAAARFDRKAEASDADVTLLLRTPTAPYGARGGTSRQLDVTIRNPQGHALPNVNDKHTVWTSLHPDVATVDSTGRVTAQGLGVARVVVAHKQATDTVRVAVVPVPVRSVLVTGADSIGIGDSTTFRAVARDSVDDALEGRTVVWSTATPTLVTTTTTPGEFVGAAAGVATITATVEGVQGTSAMRVTPQAVAAVTVTPAVVSLPQFRRATFTAVARDKRGTPLAGRAIAWSSSAPAILTVAATGEAVARDVGSATVTATSEGKSGSAAVTVTNPVEARALWVTRFEFTTGSAVDFAKIATIFQKAASANFNVVYFQVRTSGDALYYSDLEPCSPRMCGRLGGPRPAQDPLAVALREAAKYGIEVHAWLNAYTGFISGSATACNQFIESTPRNWLKAHPEWSASTKDFATGVLTRQVDNCLGTREYMWVSPGVPEVRAQVATVAADIATRYGPLGLKGIHLDRVRYSANNVSYDPGTQEAFRAATGAYPTSNFQASYQNFRRDQVSRGVREVYQAVRAVNPRMVVSAAVFPGYKPRSGWAAAWSFTDYFQDPQAWAEGGYLDVEVPMNYPAIRTSASWTVKAYCSNTDWTCVMDDHVARIERQAGRHVYVGVGAIKGWDEVKRQLDLAHDRAITGVSVYSYSQVDAIPNGWAQLAAGPFKHKATIPAMPWK